MSFKNLRTLTRKSLIGFGPFRNCTVEYMINQHRAGYLISLYYSASMISFREDVLDFLGITEEWRVEKPGIDKEVARSFFEANGYLEVKGVRVNQAYRKKLIHRKFYNVDRKAKLQAKNLRKA